MMKNKMKHGHTQVPGPGQDGSLPEQLLLLILLLDLSKAPMSHTYIRLQNFNICLSLEV